MSMLDLFREVVNGKIWITRSRMSKLEERGPGNRHRNRRPQRQEIATDLYKELERTYTQVKAKSPLPSGCRPKPWRPGASKGIVPRGAMREIMELMHRTHMGVDQHYENITKQCSRTPWPTAGAAPWWPPRFPISCSAPPPRCGGSQHGRAQGRPGQHHRPRPRAQPVRVHAGLGERIP
jgi:hypothetical protein